MALQASHSYAKQQLAQENQLLSNTRAKDFRVGSHLSTFSDGVAFTATCTKEGHPDPDKVYTVKLMLTGASQFGDLYNEWSVLFSLPVHPNIVQWRTEFKDLIVDDFFDHLPPQLQRLSVDASGNRHEAQYVVWDNYSVNMAKRRKGYPIPFPFGEAERIGRELLELLIFLGTHCVVYLNLKLDNLMVGDNGQLLLSDFTKSKKLSHNFGYDYKLGADSPGGDKALLAPEILHNFNIVENVDYSKQATWEFGVFMFTLILGFHPLPDYPAKYISKTMYSLDDLPKLPASYPKEMREVLPQMLEPDPQRRMTLENAKHALFTAIKQAKAKDFKIVENKHLKNGVLSVLATCTLEDFPYPSKNYLIKMLCVFDDDAASKHSFPDEGITLYNLPHHSNIQKCWRYFTDQIPDSFWDLYSREIQKSTSIKKEQSEKRKSKILKTQFLVLEWLPDTMVTTRLLYPVPLPVSLGKKFALDIISAALHLQSNKQVHFGLTQENVAIASGSLVLSGFDCAIPLTKQTMKKNTLQRKLSHCNQSFVAPEIVCEFNKDQLDSSIDEQINVDYQRQLSWGVGKFILMLITGTDPLPGYPGSIEYDCFKLALPSEYPQQFHSLVQRLLHPNVDHRATLNEAFKIVKSIAVNESIGDTHCYSVSSSWDGKSMVVFDSVYRDVLLLSGCVFRLSAYLLFSCSCNLSLYVFFFLFAYNSMYTVSLMYDIVIQL